MKKRLFYILLFSILTLSGFAQKEKGLMSRLRLNLEPVYILHESDADEFRGKAKTFKLLTKDVNPNNVYRLFLYGHTFQFEYPISKQDLPNLQELTINKACYIPDNLSQYSKLQYLIIVNLLGETCSECIGRDTNKFTVPYVFPENMYKLNNLKKLNYSICLEHNPYIYISERLFKLNKISVYADNYRDFSSLFDVIEYYFYDPIFNLLQGKINDGYVKYKKKCIAQFHKNGSFSKKNKSGIVIQGNFYRNKAEGEWRIEFPTGCRSTFWGYDSLPEDDAYTEVRYYKNGLEDSVWSIINAQGDTLRRDYFSNGVWKKIECIYKTSYGFEIVLIDNLYDFSNRIEIHEIKEYYPNRVKIHETNFYRNRYHKSIDYFKNGSNINSTRYFINDSILIEKNKLNTKDSSYSKSIINGILNKEEIIYTNGSAHYKYYTPIDQISRYDVVAPKNNLTTTEEFFKPEYLRIEYNQDRNKKYLFHRTYYNKQGAILNQDTVNITDRGLINTTYYLDTIVKKERLAGYLYSPGYYRYTYKNIKGETIYTKTDTEGFYDSYLDDYTIEEEFFQPDYVKIKYYKDKQNTNIIYRYYYNKSEKIIKQDTINPNDYKNLRYRNITLPTEHNK